MAPGTFQNISAVALFFALCNKLPVQRPVTPQVENNINFIQICPAPGYPVASFASSATATQSASSKCGGSLAPPTPLLNLDSAA